MSADVSKGKEVVILIDADVWSLGMIQVPGGRHGIEVGGTTIPASFLDTEIIVEFEKLLRDAI